MRILFGDSPLKFGLMLGIRWRIVKRVGKWGKIRNRIFFHSFNYLKIIVNKGVKNLNGKKQSYDCLK